MRLARHVGACTGPVAPHESPRVRNVTAALISHQIISTMKKFLLFGWWLAALVPMELSAATLTAGPAWAAEPNGNVTVRWTTDVATGSRVQYGTLANKLDQRADGELGLKHVVILKGLLPGTTYHYTVGTARQALATNSFTLAGDAPTKPEATSETAAVKPGKGDPKPAPKAPPTRQTWGNLPSLQDHFDRHGADFKAADPDDYARLAWEFLQRGKRGEVLVKLDDEGVMRLFDSKTRAFAAYNRDGTTKTFFKPNSRDYFDRQPGTLVKLSDKK